MTIFEKAWNIVKRDVRDPIHGSLPDAAALVTTRGTEIKPARKGGVSQMRSGHTKRNDRVIHSEGSPISSKGDKNTDKTGTEKLVDAKLKRLNIDGQRGQEKQKS